MQRISGEKLIPPGLIYLAENVTSRHNILGASRESKSKWAKGLKLPAKGDTIFFAGCGYQYSDELESLMGLLQKADKSVIGPERLASMAGIPKKLGIDATGLYTRMTGKGESNGSQPLTDAVRILNKIGVDFGYLGDDEPCCGGILHFAGFHREFVNNSQSLYQTLKSRGVKRIISIVPSCTYTLRNPVAECVESYDIEVKHFVEVLAEKLPSIKLRFPDRVKITYHDSCQLARFLGLIKEPRKILNGIENLEMVEPDHTTGEWATCCGGGGGFEAVFPEMSHILAVNRARELVDTGAEIIVTHCPGCILQLKSGLKELKKDNIKVMDLAQVVAMSMED